MSQLSDSLTLIWAVFGIVLLIAEMLTGTFVLLFFGLSALGVAALRGLGLENLPVELLVFSVLGALGLLFFRKRLIESLKRGGRGAFSIDVESTLRLSDPIPAGGEAPISYQGTKWTAVNESDEYLVEGTKVVICKVDGIKLHVKKAD